MPLPAIPGDINAAPSALRSEFFNYIETLIDAAQPVQIPGEGNDLLLGTDAAQSINGRAGNDVIAAFGGADHIFGSFGDDYILAGAGNDFVYGEDGNDFLFGGDGQDRLTGGDGDDALFGGASADALVGGDGNDWLFTNTGNDSANGGAGNDLIYGGTGANSIAGGADNDRIFASSGRDMIGAGSGNDFIEGGADADRIVGGLGDDVFYYASRAHGNDTITDFVSSQDVFQFRGRGFGVDPGTNLDDGVTFIANAAPVSVVAQATVLYETDTGRLLFDIDGTGAAASVLIATLTGAPDVTHQDFIFV